MSVFGDDTPEDAWHPDDPVAAQLDNLRRRVELLVGRPMRSAATDPGDVLDALALLVAQARRHHLSTPDRIRADLADDDIDHVRDRL